MRSRLRHSLVLTILVALVLGVSGTAAPPPPIGLLVNPTDTKVAGIDVDATTIPELQKLMNSRRLSSVELTSFYLRRIHQLNPTLNAVITAFSVGLSSRIRRR